MMRNTADATGGEAEARLDVIVVGAGFAGLYLLHRLRSAGRRVHVFEAASGVGGTWWWNRYPGARVDVESQEYAYAFSTALAAEWRWSERYAAQPELLSYLEHVADRFDLLRDITFDTRVTAAAFDAASSLWTVTTDTGTRVTARFCIMATGCLSAPKEPDIDGWDRFSGQCVHTGRWPHEGVDFTGKTVGVIGTGSSAIQSIPRIAETARQVIVFQRTPNFSVPAHNGPFDPAAAEAFRENPAAIRREALATGAGILQVRHSERTFAETPEDERRRTLEERWARGGFALLGAFADGGVDPEANAMTSAFVAEKIRAIVKDPATAEALVPKDYPIGAKRLCVDTGYYETFNRPNVALVDLRRDPLVRITPRGVLTQLGEHDVDILVLAVGFDAMTGALSKIRIEGADGRRLSDAWAEGPSTYLGLMVAGFPNLFLVTGPGSPSVLTNMAVSIEQHVDWITDCIAFVEGRQGRAFEALPEAQSAWTAHVSEVAEATLFMRAASWYVGANVPGKPRVFLPYAGGLDAYRQECEAVAAEGYRGFRLST